MKESILNILFLTLNKDEIKVNRMSPHLNV